MFCKWCGRKISNNGDPCPSCGKNQDPLESGNSFWDLCKSESESQTGMPDTIVAQIKEVKPISKRQTDNSDTKKSRKYRSSMFFGGVQLTTFCLLVIAIAVTSIGAKKIFDRLTELETAQSDIVNLKTIIDSGFEKIDEYHHTSSDSDDTQTHENTGYPEDDKFPAIDELLETGALSLDETNQMFVEKHVITQMYPESIRYLYLASGDILSDETAKICWQKSSDGGTTWQTVSEALPYLVVNNSEEAVYRILCLISSDFTSQDICYYALASESSNDHEDDGNTEMPGEFEETADDTTPTQGGGTQDETAHEQSDEPDDSGSGNDSNRGLSEETEETASNTDPAQGEDTQNDATSEQDEEIDDLPDSGGDNEDTGTL